MRIFKITTLGTVTLLAAFVLFVSNQLLDSDNGSIYQQRSSQLEPPLESNGSRVLSYADNGSGETKKITAQDDVSSTRQQQSSFIFDSTPFQHMSHEDAEGLQEDGTYLLFHDYFRSGPNESCMLLVEAENRIKRVHYHFSSCKKFGELRLTS